MDLRPIQRFVDDTWQSSILPALREYVTIPNQSPAFDPGWREHGHMDRAVELVGSWMRSRRIDGLNVEVIRLPGRTPVILAEIPSRGAAATVLLYGHLDKQPPMEGWSDGLGPWNPVTKDGKLYGRGAADDGYAAFASLAAIEALEAHGLPHTRAVVLIEACEESGSYDLPAYVEALAARIGAPDLVVCLDSGCASYDRLWVTTSLRGLVGGTLTVSTLSEGVHSGAAGGVVPSSFRIARRLLDRLEDSETGRILPSELQAEIPADRVAQAAAAAAALGPAVRASYPWAGDTAPMADDVAELLLDRTWRPALEVVGAAGLPPPESAGNVLRPRTTLKLSVRLPPTVDAERAAARLADLLRRDPPNRADVTFSLEQGSSGWNAPPLAPWLERSLSRASQELFGRPACLLGEGGTIPFMAMLGARFPRAQFVITGVLGPHSNAHGPNEFLEIATATKLTGSIAAVLADHHAHHASRESHPEARAVEKEEVR